MAEKDEYSADETARRMERGLRRALSTPPQPHGKNPRTPPLVPGRRKTPKTRKTVEYQAFVEQSIERFPQPSLRPAGAFREDLESERRET
jgi:hypothetical protein